MINESEDFNLGELEQFKENPTDESVLENTEPQEVQQDVVEEVAQEQAIQEAIEEQYQPNLKYSFKGEQHEFDELAKSILQSDNFRNEQYENYFRDLHSKARGLEFAKQRRDEFRNKYQDVNSKYEQLNTDLGSLRGHIERNDYAGFLQAAGLDQNKFLDWARKYTGLDDMSRKIYDQQMQYQRELELQRSENQKLVEQRKREEIQSQERMIEMELSEFKSDAAVLDKAWGEGTFKNLVYRKANQLLAEGKHNISLRDVAKEVLQGTNVFQSQAVQAQPVQTTNTGIPNIKGSSGAVAKKPKDLDDIMKAFVGE